jgi:hypothetical protein
MITDEQNISPTILYDFHDMDRASGWIIINDGVMGGLSKGNISLDSDGNGLFWGHVSLANNGGFSLARLSLSAVSVKGKTKVVLELKGDEKNYQFRLKNQRNQMHSYVKTFQTSGTWERIEIPFEELEPRFRGRHLNLPPFPADQIEEIGLLIGNKAEEDFQLTIRSISLE